MDRTRRLIVAGVGAGIAFGAIGTKFGRAQPVPTAPSQPGRPPSLNAQPAFTYLKGDQTITRESAQAYSVIVAGNDILGEPNLARVFESNDAFSEWADRGPYGEKVREIIRIVRNEVPKERRNEEFIRKIQTLALKQQNAAFRGFADVLGKDPRDGEVIRRAVINRTPLTPKLFDPVLLYDRLIEHEPPQGAPEDPRTSMLPVPSGFWPYLGWVGWNDRARSVRIFGVNVLCENAWFGGRWGWLIGFNGLFNLNHILFDRVASSAIAS